MTHPEHHQDFNPTDSTNILVLKAEIERLTSENVKLKNNIQENNDEALFRDMFLENNAVQLIINPKTAQIHDANFSASKFYGYSISELKNFKISDLNQLPNDTVLSKLQEAIERKNNYFKFQHRLATGELRDVEVYSSPINYHDKQYLLSIVHDITERIKTKLALHRSEERYRKLSELTFEGILIHRDGIILDTNTKFSEIVEYSREEIIGRKVMDFVAPESHRKVSNHIQQNRTKTYEANILNKSGKKIFVELEAKHINKNGEEVRVVAIRNITERKKAQFELQRIYRRQQIIMDTVPIGIAFMSQRKFVFLNRAVGKIFKYRSDELINQGVKMLYAKEKTYEYIGDTAYPMLERGKTFKDECLMMRNTGDVFWCEITGRSVSKEKEGSIWTFEDVNRRKKNELTLHRTYDNLKISEKAIKEKNLALEKAYDDLRNTQSQLVQSEKMASLGQLTAGIAHEMNNPLTFIYGGADALRYNLEDFYEIYETYKTITPENFEEKSFEIQELTEDYDENFDFKNEFFTVLDDIQAGANRMSDIVKSLRIFTRRDEAILKKADIHENLNATLLLLHRRCEESNITIYRQFDEGLPHLECYFGKLNQVFVNVLNNALEANTSEIRITTSMTEIEAKKYVQIAFQDNGDGIPEEIHQKIFEPFFSTKSMRKGLGLSMVYEIVQEHSGFIQLNSILQKGTGITLQIPVGLSSILKEQGKKI